MNRLSSISFSIYYTKQGWPNLLKSGLAPLIQHLETDTICNKYAIYFCEEQGEHIRLVLHLQPTVLHKIPVYQSTIETFLNAYPTQRITKPLPLHDSFFLDLPNNHVYLNSFKPFFSYTDRLNSLQTALIRQEISTLILDSFADNMVNKESLFNFYLCSEIVALAVFNNPLDATKVIQADYEKLAAKLPATGLIRLESEADILIKNNIDDLNQMVALVMHGDYTTDTKWLEKWFQTCRQMATTAEPIGLFRDISMLICQHINFHHTKWSALSLAILNHLLTNQSIIQLK